MYSWGISLRSRRDEQIMADRSWRSTVFPPYTVEVPRAPIKSLFPSFLFLAMPLHFCGPSDLYLSFEDDRTQADMSFTYFALSHSRRSTCISQPIDACKLLALVRKGVASTSNFPDSRPSLSPELDNSVCQLLPSPLSLVLLFR
jgi:hypothetical protein